MVALSLIVWKTPPLQAQGNTTTATYFVMKIMPMLQEGRFHDVIQECAVTLLRSPHNTEALWYRALCYRLMGADSSALYDLNSLIAVKKTSAALAERATVLHRLQRHNEALAEIDAVIAQEPATGKWYAIRGALYHAVHKLDHACRDFTTAQALGHALANDLMLSYCRGVLSSADDTLRHNDEKTQRSSGAQAMNFLLSDTDSLYTAFDEWTVSAGYERRGFLVSRLYYDTRNGEGIFVSFWKAINRRIALGIKVSALNVPFTFGGERGGQDSVYGAIHLWDLGIYARYAAPVSRSVDITGIVGTGFSIMNFPVGVSRLNAFNLPVMPNNGIPNAQGVTVHLGLGFEVKPLKRLHLVGFMDVAIAMMNYNYTVSRETRTLSEVSTWNIGVGLSYSID